MTAGARPERFAGLLALPRAVIWLSAAAFFTSLSLIAMKFVALYLTVTFDTSITGVGWMLAAYGVGSIIGAFGGGQLMERIGCRPVMVGSLLALAPAFVALALAPAPAIPVLLFVIGILQSAFRPAYNGAILRLCAPDEHSRAYSAYLTAVNIGGSIAGAAGGILATQDFRFLFIAAAFPPLIAAVLAWHALRSMTADPNSRASERNGASRRAVLGDRPFLALCLIELICAFLIAQLFSTYPIYLKDEYGFSPEAFGYLLMASGLLVAAFSLPVTAVAGRYRDHAVTAFALILFCGGFAALPLGNTAWFVIATMLIWTFGEILLWPVLMKLVMQRAVQGAGGTYLGIYHSIFSLSQIVSPLIGTALYAALGGDALWFIIAGLGILALVVLQNFAPGRDMPAPHPIGAAQK